MLLKMSDLASERLLLREFRQTDRAEVARWEPTFRAEIFLEFCLQSYREWGMGPWAMILGETSVIVGNCGFCRIRYDRDGNGLEYCGEVNYYVAPPYRRQGLASEALKTVLEFGFGDIRLTRIQGRCAPTNVGSERVMQKAGMKFDRMIAALGGASVEERLYAVTREDFERLRAS
jgi:RimJ/RimL family protein N-acetyltransferase